MGQEAFQLGHRWPSGRCWTVGPQGLLWHCHLTTTQSESIQNKGAESLPSSYGTPIMILDVDPASHTRATINQDYLWHITEAHNLQSIEDQDILLPAPGTRGFDYSDTRLHFLTILNDETVKEISEAVRFGGCDMTNNRLVRSRQQIDLVLLELDMTRLQTFDDYLGWKFRPWFKDVDVSENIGVWTPLPVPFADSLTVRGKY